MHIGRNATHPRARRVLPRGHRGEGSLDRSGRSRASSARICAGAELQVLEVVSGLHTITDLTLGIGKVAVDYLR
jgi:hypothetical protein